MSLESKNENEIHVTTCHDMDGYLDNEDNSHDENKSVNGLDSDDESDDYYLISNDDKKFKLAKSAYAMSGLVKTALEGDTSSRQLDIPGVDSEMMTFISAYLNYHSENPVSEKDIHKKVISNDLSENIECEWDVNFIENDVMGNADTALSNLHNLIVAANYMDIKSLLHLACTKVACMVKSKRLDEIKKTFLQ